MKVFKWERLKEKAKCEIYRKNYDFSPASFLAILPALTNGIKPRKLLDDWVKEAAKIVDQWDVRMCRKLIECFPSTVNSVKFSEVYAEYNENCEWVVILK